MFWLASYVLEFGYLKETEEIMIRVGFTGIPSTGKTSIARALAAFFKKTEDVKNLELIAEYARTYIENYGPMETIWEQYKVLDKQLDKENRVPKHTDLLITDSPLPLAFLYVLDLRKDTAKDSMVVDDMFHKINSLNRPRRYDIIFHLPPTIEVVNDGVRPEKHCDPVWRAEADSSLIFICKTLFPPKSFVVVEPTELKARVNFCNKTLEEYIASKAKT